MILPNKKYLSKWTIMIYMAANDDNSNKLSMKFRKELSKIGEVLDSIGDNVKVNILLQTYLNWGTKTKKNYRTKRFKIQTDFENNVPLLTLDSNVSMKDSKTLTGFINWCKTNYPAEKYLLLLWGHSTGSSMFCAPIEKEHKEIIKKHPEFKITNMTNGSLVPMEDILHSNGSIPVNSSGEKNLKIYYRSQKNRKSAAIITIPERFCKTLKNKPKNYFRSGNPEILYKVSRFMTSKPNLFALVGKEIDKSLANSFGTNGKVDLLLIFGCCMQMVEFGYEIRNHCRYFVASEELMYFEGYNYFDTFSYLIKNPDLEAHELGMKIVSQTPERKDYNKNQKSELSICCVDLQYCTELVDKINDISKKMVENFDKLKEIIRASRIKCSHFGQRPYGTSFIDVIWFFKKFRDSLMSKKLYPNLCKRISLLITFIEKKYIIKRYIGERRKPKAWQIRSIGGHGVGIYFPRSYVAHLVDDARGKYFNKKNVAYVNSFSKQNKWNDVIIKYIEFLL